MDDVTASEKRPSLPRASSPGVSPEIAARLEALGAEVAKVSDRAADPTTLPNARRRWLSAEVPARRARKVPALWLSLAGAVVAAAVLVFVWRRDPAVSFTVGAQASAGSVGQWVAPDGDAMVDVRFSEGTLVTLAPGARLRVTETSSHGATLLIERGSLHAAITHRDADTRWSVQAGPFEVRVTGTSFDARWDPATETFELTMLEGSVVVSGPRLPSGRSVVAGEQLIVSTNRMELRAGAVPPPPSALPSAAPPASCASPASSSPAPAPTTSAIASDVPAIATVAPTSSADADASWKALARAGKYRDAMNAAEAAGFSTEVARASSSELLALADAARFAGRPARAKEALLAMRKRFGARGSSAFLLGKISADQLGAPGEAVTWFETYLQEESGGPLAEQALGRVLEIRKKDPGAARVTAERYLARYPNGAYAALARSLVGPR